MADFEAGSIFIAFRSATDALVRGFRKARGLFARMGVSAEAFRKRMSRAANAVGRVFRRMGRVISRAALVIKIALVGALVAGVKFASDLTEATNKMNAVFGDSSEIIEEFAESSARNFGIAESDAKSYAATLGQILKVSGLTAEASAEMSIELLKLAADMASFNDISIDEALTKIQAGLVGEVEPLRRVGVLLSEAAVQTKALELGLASSKDEITDQIKVQARFALIMEQTADAQGDFQRTSDEFANSLRIVGAQLKNVLAIVGQALLPVLTVGLNKLKDILDLVPAIITAIKETFETFKKTVSGEGLGNTLQRVASAVTDFLIALFASIVEFARENAFEIGKTWFKIMISIVGPSMIKIMKLIGVTVKAGLLQLANVIRLPFDLAVSLIENTVNFLMAEFNDGIAQVLRDAITAFEGTAFGQFLFSEEDFNKAREFAKLLELVGEDAKKRVKSIEEVLGEVETRFADFAIGIDENLKAEREEIEKEIDELTDALRESGVLGEAMAEAAKLLRKGLDAGSAAFKKALGEATTEMGIDVDEIISKIRAAVVSRGLQKPGTEGSGLTPVAVPIVDEGPGLSAEQIKEIEDLGKATREAIASSVAGGISDGVLEGKGALSILADVGRRLFKNAFNVAVQSFQKALDAAIAESGIKAQAVLSGVLNAAVAIVGLLLSQLDRAGDSSRRFGKLDAAAESSQLVRGVIAGPSNIAIAEVGENLKRALATTEDILRQSLFVQMETRDKLGGRGNGIQGVPTAGTVPITAP